MGTEDHGVREKNEASARRQSVVSVESNRSQRVDRQRDGKIVFIQSSLVICIFRSISVQREEFTVRDKNRSRICLDRDRNEKLMKIDVMINSSRFELIFIC